MTKKEMIIFLVVIFCTVAPISSTNTNPSTKPNDYTPCKISAGVFACLGFFLPCICLCICGFTGDGVRGDSCASGYQSGIGDIASGSCFSSMQSCAATGFRTCLMFIPSMFFAACCGTGAWYACKAIVDDLA